MITRFLPSDEREFDYASHKGALVSLTGYASPKRLRHLAQARLTPRLRRQHVCDAAGAQLGQWRPPEAKASSYPGSRWPR